MIGAPQQHAEGDFESLWIYVRPKGKVTITHAEQASLPFLPRVWLLDGDPYDSAPSAFFHSAILPYIPLHSNNSEVTVMNNCGYPGVAVSLEKGKITRIAWLDNTGSGGQRDRRRPR